MYVLKGVACFTFCYVHVLRRQIAVLKGDTALARTSVAQVCITTCRYPSAEPKVSVCRPARYLDKQPHFHTEHNHLASYFPEGNHV